MKRSEMVQVVHGLCVLLEAPKGYTRGVSGEVTNRIHDP